MNKRFLEDCLARGMSLEKIAERVGRHPSTVSYWLAKYGMSANGVDRFAPRGGIDWEVLEIMVDDGLTLREIADELDRSLSTVRYWIRKHGFQTQAVLRRRDRTFSGPKHAIFECKVHGSSEFVLENRGYYRCKRCRSAAVSKRRRVVKQKLIEESGGACAICGFADVPAALQFHHLDSAAKEFHIAHRGHSRSLARCRKEIQKCILLCANCHAAVEAGALELPVQLTDQEAPSEVTQR